MVVADIDNFETARMYLEAQPPVGGDVQGHHVALDMPSLLKSMTVPNGCNGTNVRSLAKLREPCFELGTNPKPLTALVNERPDLPITVLQLHAASPKNVPREGPCTRRLRQKNSSAFSASIWRRSLCQMAKYQSLGEDLRPAHMRDADRQTSRSMRTSAAAKRMNLFSMADNADDAPMR